MRNVIKSCRTNTKHVVRFGKTSFCTRALTIIALLALFVVYRSGNLIKGEVETHGQSFDHSTHIIGRRLTQYRHKERDNCSVPSVKNFPNGLFTQQQRKHGAVIFHILIAIYMFWAIAVCCDSYFVPSLEEMCDRLNLQTDVAGATLMAIGSSAPELFAAIIGVFITKGDIGIGTILGSAVFNVLFVIGACGLLSGAVLMVSWWPMTRDAICYAISLFLLTIVIFDGEVRWYEATAMVLLYPIYVILMYFNPTLEKRMYQYLGDAEAEERRFAKSLKSEDSRELLSNDVDDSPENAEEYKMMEMSTSENSGIDGSSEDKERCSCMRSLCKPPLGLFRTVIWIVELPIRTIFHLTIPDVNKKHCRKYYSVGFIVSIVWIGVLSYILLWMVTVAGFTAGVSDTVMGLTFVAFGSSVPDCLSSLLVARQGDGDMAVSHTIGSNVFDILLCLGVPWLIKTTLVRPREPVIILSHGLFVSCFVILGSLLFAMVTMTLGRWRLGKKVGGVFLSAYLIFVLIAVIVEITVFEKHALPLCS